MDIGAALRQIYPEAPACEIFGGGDTPWIVRDDGDGPFLSDWNYSKPKPSADAIVAAWLTVQKNHAWESIKIERDRRKAGGFKVGTLWFHSDADSRIQHLGLKDKARDLLASGGAMADSLTILGQPVRWKTMDGTFAAVTAQLAFDIVAAAVNLDARLFTVAATHRAAMEAAADPAAYDFSAGWPETFGG